MRSKIDVAIDEVMDNFDFNRAVEIYKAVGWTWAQTRDGRSGIPEAYDLRKEARRLLRAMTDESGEYRACGGLVARNEHGILSLTLEAASAEVEIEYVTEEA